VSNIAVANSGVMCELHPFFFLLKATGAVYITFAKNQGFCV
jgi:hypothetical protein